MPVFSNSEELVRVMVSLWERIKADQRMCDQILRSKLVVQFRYRDPDAVITIDCSDGQEMKISSGPGDQQPIVEMSMKADVAHEFWMGRVSVPVAILTGKMASKGPTPKALALLPVIRPAFNIYPDVLKESGKHALVK